MLHDVCVGIDLAGVERRETGLALLRDGRLEQLQAAAGDDEILAFAALAGPAATIAIDAPLSLPRGRCCLNDDCRCRHDPGTRSRECERALLRMRVPVFATALINVLARRGIAIAAAFRSAGQEPLEVYPQATFRLLGMPAAAKRTPLGKRRIHDALQALVPGLDHPGASDHMLDAVVCAVTARLWQQGLTVSVGVADEGLMVIPDVSRLTAIEALLGAGPPQERRVAESRASYEPSQFETS
jgi:predicted nuclease with RNAse H fold